MKTLIAIIAAIVVVGAGWYGYTTFYAPTAEVTPSTGTVVNSNPEGQDYMPVVGSTTDEMIVEDATPTNVAVTLTATGFSPKSVTVKKGGTVTFTNESTGKMWVASAQHPTHTVYAGTTLQQHCSDSVDVSFDQCKSGTTYSFTFNKVGSWNYHNHSNSQQFGTVVVVE